MIRLTLMWLSLCASMGDKDYPIRRDAQRAVRIVYRVSPIPLPLYYHNAEGRARCAGVWNEYTSVTNPPRLSRFCLDHDEWWELYAAVTGVKRDDLGWFFMPWVDEEFAMVRELIHRWYRRGAPRWGVEAYLWYLQYTDPWREHA